MVLKCIIKDDDDNIKAEFLIDPIEVSTKDGVIISDAGLKDIKQNLKELPEKAFDKVFNFIPFLSEKLHNTINDINKGKPNELKCEFSLGFDIEGNIILAKASINAQFKVQLKWDNF